MKTTRSAWDCDVEGCGTRVQPLDPSTGWYDMAVAHLKALGLDHRNRFLLAHAAHRLIVHDDQP